MIKPAEVRRQVGNPRGLIRNCGLGHGEPGSPVATIDPTSDDTQFRRGHAALGADKLFPERLAAGDPVLVIRVHGVVVVVLQSRHLNLDSGSPAWWGQRVVRSDASD